MNNFLRILAPVLLLLGTAANTPASVITGYATENGDTGLVGTQAGGIINYYFPIKSGPAETMALLAGHHQIQYLFTAVLLTALSSICICIF